MLTMNRLNRVGGLSDSLWNFFDDLEYSYPSCEETDEGYELQLNIAGLKKENIKVHFEDGLLKVRAEQGERKYAQEFRIPKKADARASVARYEDVILHLKINKKQESKPVDIKIS